MNVALFTLRCIQVGLTLADLDFLTYGQVNDILTECSNDDCEYPELATQEDFDKF